MLTPVASGEAQAQPPVTEAKRLSEAKRLFAKGTEQYLAKHYGEALETLRSSYTLAPSPNSELVIARCMRELGRLVDAQETFAEVETEARRRAAQGEAKYARTADTAATEGAAVRAQLGTLRIRIDDTDPGTKLEIDGTPTPIPDDGNVLAWHAPGDATVLVRPASGGEQKQVATVRAGAEVKMEFARPEPTPPPVVQPVVTPPTNPPPLLFHDQPPPPILPPEGSGWTKPAAWISGGLAVVGGGMFAGFGLASKSLYDHLNSECTKGACANPTSSETSDRQTGKRYQTIANVSLIVGSVAAAATLTFIIIGATSSGPTAVRSAPLRVMLGVGHVGLGGEFE
jgi:hypothetical protein